MPATRGTWDENGYLVKADCSGKAWPESASLLPVFEEHNIKTLPDVLKYGASIYSDNKFMATRILQDRNLQEKGDKCFEKLSLGKYTWQTYDEVQSTAEAVGCSLRKLGLGPQDRIAIFAETRAEWFISAMGALQQRITVCTVYTTLNDSGIIHALNETEVTTIVSSSEQLSRLVKLLESCPLVKTIVLMEDQLNGLGDLEKVPSHIKIVPYTDMSSVDNIDHDTLETKPSPEDIAIIMYTSGSTGTPKGVEMTHSNILASVIAYSCQVNVGPSDRYLAFLPLAHILELATEIALIPLGVKIFYSSPHTMTTSSPKIAHGNIGDAKIAKPTLINAVPLLLDRIIKGVRSAVEKQGKIKSLIFFTALYFKFWIDRVPALSKLVDRIIFQKVREELGGNLTRVVVGGAPLSAQCHTTFTAIFGVSLQVGYAATETSSCTSGMYEFDSRTGHCGHPCLKVLVKLEDWEEGDYRLTDKPFPRGEIIIGGPSVVKGYFKMPEETKKSFFEKDGVRWFRSGDIGHIDSDGCIKIIDRKKDLVKLKHGEYISLGNAESVLKSLSVVDNICVFADSSKDKTVAVIVPDLAVLKKIASRCGINPQGRLIEDLSDNEKVQKALLKEVQNHGKKCGLSRWEIPAAVHIAREMWTPDTGLVTAAFKLRRHQIGRQYRNMVLDMYSKLD